MSECLACIKVKCWYKMLIQWRGHLQEIFSHFVVFNIVCTNMAKTFLSRNIKYVYAEVQTKKRSNERVIVLFIEGDEHQPLERQHMTLDDAKQLHKDLSSLIEQVDRDIEEEEDQCE